MVLNFICKTTGDVLHSKHISLPSSVRPLSLSLPSVSVALSPYLSVCSFPLTVFKIILNDKKKKPPRQSSASRLNFHSLVSMVTSVCVCVFAFQALD